MKVKVKPLSRVQLFATPWTIACQAPPSMGFSRQEYWSGLPSPSPGDLPNPGIEPRSPTLQADTLTSEPPGKPHIIIIIPYLSSCAWLISLSIMDSQLLNYIYSKVILKVIEISIWKKNEDDSSQTWRKKWMQVRMWTQWSPKCSFRGQGLLSLSWIPLCCHNIRVQSGCWPHSISLCVFCRVHPIITLSQDVHYSS